MPQRPGGGAALLYDAIVQHISAFVVGLFVLVFRVFVAQIGPVCAVTASFWGFLYARTGRGSRACGSYHVRTFATRKRKTPTCWCRRAERITFLREKEEK